MYRLFHTVAPFWDAADGGNSGSMFKAGEGGDATGADAAGAAADAGDTGAAEGAGDQGEPGADGGADGASGSEGDAGADAGAGDGDRPDWLLDKFKSAEDQAKGYKELQAKLHTKTELLRKEVLAEAVAEYGQTIGVPEDAEGYEYPEGVQPPGEELDGAFRQWAKENNVSPEGFQKLVSDVWSKTQTNAKAEFEKLGSADEATARIEAVNKWANKSFTADDHATLERIMQTAEGVGFLERMMNKGKQSGVFSDDGGSDAPSQLTRENIRQMQADPKFGNDPAYTEKVRGMWAKYAALPDSKKI